MTITCTQALMYMGRINILSTSAFTSCPEFATNGRVVLSAPAFATFVSYKDVLVLPSPLSLP